ASAAFTDVKADTKYAEAIGVLSGIGVIDGMTKDTFAPDGTLTREQAAKMVAYLMLGPTNAKLIGSATSQKFSDVAANRWSAGYIEYCANLGIISGVGDKKFNPEGKLTTAAFTKMLLCAVGYKAEAEGMIGESWAINVASLAVTSGIVDKGIALSAATVITRGEACQLAFKALTAKTVQYKGGTSMTINGITIITGAVRDFVLGSSEAGANYDGIKGDGFMQFCESHFGGLAKNSNLNDSFGRPSTYTWTYYDDPIAAASSSAAKVYTTAVTGSKIFADLGLKSNKTATTYTDGKGNSGSFAVNYNSVTPIGGNGALTEVYVNAAGEITIVVINTYLGLIGTVRSGSAVANANVTVVPGSYAKTVGFVGGAIKATGFKVGDLAIYTVSKNSSGAFTVESIVAPEVKTVLATSYNTAAFTAGGVTYKYSAIPNGTVGAFTPYDVVLDSYGYVISVDGASATAKDYAVVLGHATATTLDGTVYTARLLMPDGTTKDVRVSATAETLLNNIVTYDVTSSIYVLQDAVTTDYTATSNIKVETNKPSFTWDADQTSGGEVTYPMNANTIFLVKSGNGSTVPFTYKAYTGMANVPGMSGAVVGEVVVNSRGVAALVYVTNPTIISGGTVGKIYLTGTYSATNDAVKGTFYTANAIIDGVVTTVDLSGTPEKGLYAGISYNANNVGTVVGTAIGTAGNGIRALSAGIMSIGGTALIPAADCAVYYISPVSSTNIATGIGSVSSVAGIMTDATDTVVYTTNAQGLVTAIYIQQVTADDATLATSNNVVATVVATDYEITKTFSDVAGSLAAPKAAAVTVTPTAAANPLSLTIVPNSAGAIVSVVSSNLPVKCTAGSYTVVYAVTSEDYATTVYYQLNVTVAAPGSVGIA
ncbi:MAG: S-layer homology domain-containing protein, partial [Oscillospiraceae bacterium]